jgi:hypothetical protein
VQLVWLGRIGRDLAVLHFRRRLKESGTILNVSYHFRTSDTMICGAPNYVQVGRKSYVTCLLDQVARIFSAAADGQVDAGQDSILP